MLRRMPKGGMLHAHEMALVNVSFFVENATYLDECYLYLNESSPQNGSLTMLRSPPPPGSAWHSTVGLRARAASAADFDRALAEDLRLGGTAQYLNGIAAWRTFQALFGRIIGVFSYRPVYEAWMDRLIASMLDDNVQYLELRQGFGYVYDFERGHYTAQEQLDMQQAIVRRWMAAHPDAFAGIPTIWCNTRDKDASVIYSDMEAALAFRRNGTNAAAVLGYDLVGEEHTGHTALYYAPSVLRLREAHSLGPDDLPYFFHAGESDWWYNQNVLDSLLLGTRRIGHGFTLGKHADQRRMVAEAGVAVEVCPISNRELLLLRDLRVHPAAQFVRDGVPFVLASDDPALYGYEAVSYDWYMGLVSWDMDLASLKQLAINSITYSGSSDQAAKDSMMRLWSKRWDAWIAAEDV